jgi:hypothetical protein
MYRVGGPQTPSAVSRKMHKIYLFIGLCINCSISLKIVLVLVIYKVFESRRVWVSGYSMRDITYGLFLRAYRSYPPYQKAYWVIFRAMYGLRGLRLH